MSTDTSRLEVYTPTHRDVHGRAITPEQRAEAERIRALHAITRVEVPVAIRRPDPRYIGPRDIMAQIPRWDDEWTTAIGAGALRDIDWSDDGRSIRNGTLNTRVDVPAQVADGELVAWWMGMTHRIRIPEGATARQVSAMLAEALAPVVAETIRTHAPHLAAD